MQRNKWGKYLKYFFVFIKYHLEVCIKSLKFCGKLHCRDKQTNMQGFVYIFSFFVWLHWRDYQITQVIYKFRMKLE